MVTTSMQPQRLHLDSRDAPTPQNAASTSTLPPSGTAPSHSQMPLPSIRQLHPYLPPAGMPVPMTMAGDGQPAYPTSHYNSPPHPHEMNPSYAMPESEVDELEPQCPPKKKRRRQALSCTECKRRKIKCDRSQPCAPCTRRGEQAKCHWHVVEPVEKYVTRQEFDELKSRLDDLESFVHRCMPLHSPSRPTGHYPPMPGAATPDAVQSFHPGYLTHQSIPPPQTVQSYNPGSPQVPRPPAQRPDRNDSPHRRSPTGPHLPNAVSPQINLRSRSPIASTMKPRTADAPTVIASGASASTINMSRSARPLSGGSSPPKGTMFPLSIASITSPYSAHEPQSKNCLAQTLQPGERLRTFFAILKGLAAIQWWAVTHAFLRPLSLLQCHTTVALLVGAAPRTTVTMEAVGLQPPWTVVITVPR